MGVGHVEAAPAGGVHHHEMLLVEVGLDHRAGTPARERRAQKNGPQALSRSRGGLSSKLHVVADARGRFVRGGLTAGQRHDVPQALPLLGDLAPAYLIADRSYDADALVAALAARGTCAVIPPRRKRRLPRTYDSVRYAQRQPVERLFAASSSFAAWPHAMTNSTRIFWPLFISWRPSSGCVIVNTS